MAHDLIIVEDEIFADFEPEPSPRLAALDGLNRVIRIGSFSKTLSASIRCGYIAARRDWIEDLVDLQVAINFGGPSPVAAELIASVLAGGGYRKHMDEVATRGSSGLGARSPAGCRRSGSTWLMPRGGFYLWCRLPEGQDSRSTSHAWLCRGIVLAPGNVFSVSETASEYRALQCRAIQRSSHLGHDAPRRAFQQLTTNRPYRN